MIKTSSLFKALYAEDGPPKLEEFADKESNELSDLRRLLLESNLDAASIDACRQTVSQLDSLYNILPKNDTKAEAPDFVFFIRSLFSLIPVEILFY